MNRVVPELLCTDIGVSTSFFVDVLGFDVKYERPDESFVYLSFNGVNLMLEGIRPSAHQWITGELDTPFGRGVNFEWEVDDIQALYRTVVARAPDSIYLAMETKDYACGDKIVRQKQFIVQVPDGYLFRFCHE